MSMFKQGRRLKVNWIPGAAMILSVVMIVFGLLVAFLKAGPLINLSIGIPGAHLITTSLGVAIAVAGLILAGLILRHYDKFRPPPPPPQPEPHQVNVIFIFPRPPTPPISSPEPPKALSSGKAQWLKEYRGPISVVGGGILIAILAPEIATITLGGCALLASATAFRRFSKNRSSSK